MHRGFLKDKALFLRKEGYSYKHIAEKTGFSKSTLSDWLGALPYTPNVYTISVIGKARAASGAKKSEIKRASIKAARQEAIKQLGRVTQRDLYMFGLGLYLGEGSKTNSIVRVVNSDPQVIQLAISWFVSQGIPKKNFFVTLHVYPDSNAEDSLRFWSKITTLPRHQFGKIQVDRRSNKKTSNLGKLPYGTAHMTVRSGGDKKLGAFLARKIQASVDEIAKQRGCGLPV